jgi:hypothetical protein
MRILVSHYEEMPPTKADSDLFVDWAKSQVSVDYTDQEITEWFWEHQANLTLGGLRGLFLDVHWCPKDRGGVRP